MTASKTYLQFVDSQGETQFVSISDLIHVGHPIDEDGEDLELVDENLHVFDDNQGITFIGK